MSVCSLADLVHLPGGAPSDGHFSFGPGKLWKPEDGPVTSGNLKATPGAGGLLTFTRVSDGKVLLKENGRTLGSGSDASVRFDFSSSASKLYGMGQNRHRNNGPGLGLNVVNQSQLIYEFGRGGMNEKTRNIICECSERGINGFSREGILRE